ncbi:MAG TPA: PQQ-binding-like beta-propeller repeat protein [Casimicrobiaceae bacterium]|jgi:PQQ-dependent dehydrogenase (methanol/ethanol family)|nr:PQQ-binding-like beta-propeller repeat protein [Casimicrobiaceae bacterium]
MAATGSQFVTRSRIVAFAAGMLWLAVHDVLANGTGFFSSAQLSQGRWEYSQKCSVCHGAQLQGGGAPALKGSEFSALWNGKTLKDFYDYVQANMPLGQGAALKGQEYADIVAYILAQVGLPAGSEKLTPTTPMDRVLDLSAAPAAGGAAVDASSAEVKIGELYGTLSQPTTNRPTQAELDAADASTSDWLMFNKGYRGERFSTLRRINAGNADKLKPVCMFQLGELGTFSTGPVVYDGVLYATTHLGTYAIDATTCKKVWSHQHVAQGPEMNATNKGVAIAGGRVIRGTQDGFLYALDAKTGKPLWVRQVADWRIGEGVGAAPIVWNDIVYVAKAGGDWGIRGRLMAFKVEDGTLAWSFDLIPTGNETGADTWQNPESTMHGGGAAWVTYALDRDTDTLFIPVGNPGPDYNKSMRPGANLFTISTVAVDARTGKLKWWYQLRPNDNHDWDATVVSLFDAGSRKLVATAGKEGILHVIDRGSGKLVFKLPMTTMLNHDMPITPQGVRVCPVAGVQWNGAAHSRTTGLLYVNAIDWCTVFKAGPDPKWVATVPYTGLANGWGSNDPVSKWSGWINAVDPRTGKMAWRVHTPTPMYAALTPTAGGVLFTGDLDGNFLVLNSRTGKEIYRFDTGGPIAGGVVTYEQKDRQYVAVASGSSGGSIPLTGSATIVIFGQ